MADLVITLTIPAADKTRIVDAVADEYGHAPSVFNTEWTPRGGVPRMIANPQSREDFLKAYLVSVLQQAVGASEDRAAVATDRSGRDALVGVSHD